MAIEQAQLVKELFDVFEETFDVHHGMYLDKGTSLIPTLNGITAEQASRPVGSKCASLAAQVAHVIFYLEVIERYMVAGDTGKADWDHIWRTVERVTPGEWEALKTQLGETYTRLMESFRNIETWQADPHVASILVMTVHTAYHLGEIRQAMCTL